MRCDPVDIAAPRDVVFDVLAAPYVQRQPLAVADKVTVLGRGGDMVLAALRTSVRLGLVATTVETVRFSPPERIDLRLLRGPVPHVVEAFQLHHLDRDEASTRVTYSGELATDFWGAGVSWVSRLASRGSAWSRRRWPLRN